MSRRGKGEGSISQRTDGLWVARIEVGQDPTGKRLRKAIYGSTKKEVANKLTKLASQKIDGGIANAGKMTVAELLDKWLDTARLQIAPTTYARYRSLCDLHIKPRLGRQKLSAVMAIHIDSLIANLEKSEIGAETRRYCYQVLRTAFNQAKRWKLITVNPCDDVDAPKVIRREIAPLQLEQAQALLVACKGHRLSALFVLAIAGGMRQGELFGLQREDIDLESGILTVQHSLEEIKGKLRLKRPKSKASRRPIALPQIAIDALRSHLERQPEDSMAVFTDTDGGFLRKSNFERRVWHPLREAAGIPDTVVFHDLRHTSASMLIRSKTHAKVIQERLGHSTIRLTMDAYGHLMDGMQSEAAGQMQVAMSGNRAQIGHSTLGHSGNENTAAIGCGVG